MATQAAPQKKQLTGRRGPGRPLSWLATAAILATTGVALSGGPAQAAQGAMIVPASGSITGTPNGYCGSGNSHAGFDIAGPTGASVVAAADGTVRQSDWASSPGNRVVIDHAGGWETRYLHLDSRSVTAGQTIKKGQVLGTIGSTGHSTGPHLHFQIERNDVVIRDASLLDDFRCGTTVAQGRAISYSFPGLPASDASGTYPKLREGDRGDAVTRLQERLTAAGHQLENDGVFGPLTTAAVRAFQSKIGTEVDGVVGPKTWAALETAPARGDKLRDGSTGTEVRYLQRGLNAALGLSLEVDGKFGPATRAAVISYQSSRGLAADAVVGPNTWNALKGGR
ncbi:Putative peptidoglycan binding domain-containing protein [Streptomyces zhaozhouensis]|uniref:Peptidoglycan binding domain-containing protein n=1 Tax=Streptomyces zhaozhouensis TaxID=1300267 RepID=A0A286DXN3_9ACTN|nr:peptidoglycan-binding protein [Streptomyces zhaozhouensis]SOD63422.1 Putative peptidoglycan binding domain-containing protein [Streptomyces zhaozhouensis]